MYPFWRGLQAHACRGCGRSLIWRSALQPRLRAGAWIFRAGAVVAIASIGAAATLPLHWPLFALGAVAGMSVALFGGMIAVPKTPGSWFEVVDEDA